MDSCQKDTRASFKGFPMAKVETKEWLQLLKHNEYFKVCKFVMTLKEEEGGGMGECRWDQVEAEYTNSVFWKLVIKRKEWRFYLLAAVLQDNQIPGLIRERSLFYKRISTIKSREHK